MALSVTQRHSQMKVTPGSFVCWTYYHGYGSTPNAPRYASHLDHGGDAHHGPQPGRVQVSEGTVGVGAEPVVHLMAGGGEERELWVTLWPTVAM